jgi:hypothetical protein
MLYPVNLLLHICVPIPNLDLDFQCHMSCLFVFSELMCVVTVRFVDIGGIVYHRCVKHNFIGYMHVIFNYDIQSHILSQKWMTT